MAHKLLLADDSVTIQRVIELTFADEDVQVFAVGDGQQAIERIDADPPDIILADVDMPKRDGYEVAAYVKSRPALAHIPVVLLTGAFEPVDQARAAAAGSDDVLAKPFEPQMVINRVKQLLGRTEGAGPKAASARRGVPAVSVRAGASASLAEPPRSGPARAMAPQAPAALAQPGADMPLTVPGTVAEGAQPPVSLDEYFDQLDAAFSHLHSGQPPSQLEPIDNPPSIEREGVEWSPVPTSPAGGDKSDTWDLEGLTGQGFSNAMLDVTAGPLASEPLRLQPAKHAHPAPAPPRVVPARPAASRAQDLPPVRPAVEAQMPEPQAVSEPAPAPPAPIPPPPIADAFAVLLAVEQGEPAPPRVAGSGLSVAAPVVSEALIDEVVTRVLQRLSDRVVRETVTEMVSRIAERLVREEIERIKGQTK